MKRLLILFLVLLISVWLGLRISEDPGYVLFSYKHWLIEMPLWFGIIAILVVFGGFYLLLRTSTYVGQSIPRTHAWFSRRKTRRALTLTTKGLIEFTEGEWGTAEKHLIKAASNTDNPLINYLAAARAAQEQQATTRRDNYLRKAQKSTPSAKIAVGLSQAQLQLSGGQWEQAIATLKHLRSLAPHHHYVLKLLQGVYVRIDDWQALHDLLPAIKKSHLYKHSEFAALELQTYQGLLELSAKKNSLESLQHAWQQCPTKLKKTTSLTATYAKYLIAQNAHDDAELCLRNVLKKQSDDTLFALYGICKPDNSINQLANAERWLNQHPQNSDLLLALGRICIRNKLWGKARTYLENSLELTPKTETYAELASLLQQIGEHQLAAAYYQQGLLSSLKPLAIGNQPS